MSELNVRKVGDKWQYRFEAGKVGGKRQQITKSGFKTKKMALEEGNRALAEYNSAGLYFEPTEMSVADYMEHWMKEYCAVNLKPTTVNNYRKRLDRQILPELGQYKLSALNPTVLQRFINKKFDEGYSRNSLIVLKSILSGSLSYAVEPSHFLKANPIDRVKLPSKRAIPKVPTRQKVRHVMSPEQMAVIFQRFPEGTAPYIPMQIAYHCGCRLGEVFALTWGDIDFKNKTLNINKQVQYKDVHWYITPPKYESDRTVRMDDAITTLLQREHERQMRAKIAYGEFYRQVYVDEHGVLNNEHRGKPTSFINVRVDGSYIQPRIFQHTSQVIHYELGIKDFDFHSLRHTHATMLLEAGVNPKEVQHRLGHKNIQVTLDIYSHLTEKMQADAVDIMNTLPSFHT